MAFGGKAFQADELACETPVMDTMIFIWRNFGSVLSVTSKTMIDLQ
jgi:hypothetical protein